MHFSRKYITIKLHSAIDRGIILKKHIKRLAFTLAEVLIVMGIIGVIAETTIPTLVQSTQQRETIVAVKKAYTVLQQATTMAKIDYGTPDAWTTETTPSLQGAIDIRNVFAKYLKTTKQCEEDNDATCFPVYAYLEGGSWSSAKTAALHLADGSIIIFKYNTPGTTSSLTNSAPLNNAVGPIHLDINGLKKPNVMGKDVFRFWLTASGIVVPGGTTDDVAPFDNKCLNKTSLNASGQSCTAWIIYNENMDYLKPCGTTLSWTGPTSCN